MRHALAGYELFGAASRVVRDAVAESASGRRAGPFERTLPAGRPVVVTNDQLRRVPTRDLEHWSIVIREEKE
jgi:hypothetical protein